MTTKQSGEKIVDMKEEVAKREEVINQLLAMLKYELPSNDIYDEIASAVKTKLKS